MVKIVFLIICLISALCGSTSSTNIECNYGVYDYYVVTWIYQCSPKINPNITTKESAEITEITGTHGRSSSTDDVEGFFARDQTIQFFPKGLNKFFKNIKMINIKSCELKEIHQSDLKVFPNLTSFYLYGNEIEVVEAGLFDFNLNLEFVEFWNEKKIIHIDPNVFDNLNKLRYFRFYYIPCVDSQNVNNSTEQVQEAIKIVKSKCTNSEFLSFLNQIKNLEIESKTLNPENFNTKLESFEESFKSSKLSKIRSLSIKFQNLIKSEGCSSCRQLVKIQSFVTKINEIQASNTQLVTFQNDTVDTLRSIKLTCDTLKPTLDSLKTSMNSVQNLENSIKSQQTSQDAFNRRFNDIETSLDNLKKTQNEFENSIKEIKNKQTEMKESLDEMTRMLKQILRNTF